MSQNTTLITFRVRAPPSTRTLKLYGSWDNFNIAYPMNKDLQIGSEYWHGCFNFSNIICDGKPGDAMRSRNGGLKMGGTYWYYYKVDDEVDFHNVCERATTNCPLLPGQLVNVLHVPYAFSGNRERNPSTSSTSSERRTMNPDDKFMNPRPAPSKPDVVRVSTSPVLLDFCQSQEDSISDTLAKESTTPPKFLRLAKKGSIDSYSTNNPSAALAGGLRAAFRLRTARSQSPDAKLGTLDAPQRRAASSERSTNTADETTIHEPLQRQQRGLLLRVASEEAVSTLSFEQHRRMRSISRENLRAGNSNVREQTRQVEDLSLLHSNRQPLGTLVEDRRSHDTVEDGSDKEPVKTEVNLEKRLPTLPNTPSSAYPASIVENSPPRHTMLDMEKLESHFSSTTIDTEPHLLSMALNERSHFSAWTTTTDTSSIFVDTSVPLPNNRAELPQEDSFMELSMPKFDSLNDTFSSSAFSYASISSSVSTTPSTSFLDVDAEFEAAQLSMGRPNQIPHYRLPECEFSSQTTIKAPPREPSRGRSRKPSIIGMTQQAEPGLRGNGIVHSESMQRLLDELSYLSDMIRH